MDHPSRLQQCEALPRGHPFPSLVWQVSAHQWRNRNVSKFENESRQRGIGKFLVVNRELAELFVAGDEFPVIRASVDADRAQLGGWKTRSVFDRYNIVDESDLSDAAARLDRRQAELQQAQDAGTEFSQRTAKECSEIATQAEIAETANAATIN